MKGFTLIELMIVVAVIAIIAAIAYPSYQRHILKTRRIQAGGCLQNVAQFMERYRTSHNFSYSGATVDNDDFSCMSELAAFYTIAPVASSIQASTYTIKATATGGQTRDSCGDLTLDQAGNKTAHGADAQGCW